MGRDGDMLDWFTDLISASPITYPVVAAGVCIDGFFPVVPGESLVILASILAAGGGLSVVLVFAAGLLGAVAGDNVAYLGGANLGRPAARRFFRGDRSRRLLEWAQRQLRRRGRVIIVAARFIPGGRTAVTFSCGMLEMPWRRFIVPDVVGCTLWALYATFLGYFGGEAFRESLWKPLAVAAVVASVIAAAGETYRRVTERRDAREGAPGDKG